MSPEDVPNGAPLNASHHHRAKSASETQCEEARVIFNKTIEGHYRQGKTGYRQVGVLFLTWADDDMQCKATEVVNLRDLFNDEFHFNTAYYEIPSDRWETALHKRLADFCYEYDSPEDLAIIYYGGHAYEGEETKQFKLAAKFGNTDGLGDPTAFFNDIRTCLRLPRCDQLMILDCCYAAKAFAREHVGKRKFELLTSSAHDLQSPAPYLEHSFTRALYETMKRLIKENPKGFCTSHLYREVYHNMPPTKPPRKSGPKPLLFDQARHSLGRIWLRPQVQSQQTSKGPEGGRFLKLTFRLNQEPDLAVMNEIALNLQFLPHVDQVRFEDLYAPQEQITNFMRLVLLASKLKPLVRKLHAKRQRRKLLALVAHNEKKPPASLIELHLENNHGPACDWSSASEIQNHDPKDAQKLQDQQKKNRTWPSLGAPSVSNGMHFRDEVLPLNESRGINAETSELARCHVNTMIKSFHEGAPDFVQSTELDERVYDTAQRHSKRRRSSMPSKGLHQRKFSRVG